MEGPGLSAKELSKFSLSTKFNKITIKTHLFRKPGESWNILCENFLRRA